MKIKIKISFFIFLAFPGILFSQKGIIIQSDAIVNPVGNVVLKLSGDLNFVNNSTFNQFGGKVIFCGNSNQIISGNEPSEFEVVELDNPEFLILENDVIIHNELILSAGILDISESNLTIGTDAIITGDFSSSAMISADNIGLLSFELENIGNFYFPVGSTEGTHDYTPAEITLNSGAYNNAVISLNLRNEKHPNNTSTTNYLNRYWQISGSGISDLDADLTAHYVSGDITGNEANIDAAFWNGTHWMQLDPAGSLQISGNISEFGDFTGVNRDIFSELYYIEDIGLYLNYKDGNIHYRNESSCEFNEIRIYTVHGKLLQREKITAKESFIPYHPVSHGIYLLHVQGENKIIVKKLYI